MDWHRKTDNGKAIIWKGQKLNEIFHALCSSITILLNQNSKSNSKTKDDIPVCYSAFKSSKCLLEIYWKYLNIVNDSCNKVSKKIVQRISVVI